MVIDVDKTAGDGAVPSAARAAAPLRLADWERAMRRAVQLAREGAPSHALAAAGRAAEVATSLLQAPPAGREDDCVAALVVSLHHLADVHLQAGDADTAAERLAQAHQHLLDLLSVDHHGAALQQAAWRHTRETHSALLRYAADHGQHPALARSLQAGALALSAACGPVQ